MKISWRSATVSRSRKKISSKRPLRSISGGRLEMLLVVATIKQGAVFSCIQVRIVPNTRLLIPPFTPPKAKDFSISSIYRTQGATVSARCSAFWVRSSNSPTRLPNSDFTSNRNRGNRHNLPSILAVRLLPVPRMPMKAIPLGEGNP